MNIEEFLQEIIRAFRNAGIASPEAEARILACHVLSCDPSHLMLHREEEIDDKVLLASAALINERCKGRPIQYVVGTANFYGIDLAVDERVLIPRPETELLVELAIREFNTPKSDAACTAGIAEVRKALGLQPSPKILDLCTGSGCIAAALARNLPKAEITATELSPRAFMLARVNLRPYGNVKVLRGDLFEALDMAAGLSDSMSAGTKVPGCPKSGASAADTAFDAILSNPPYVPSGAIPGLSREVRDHEPVMALDGGSDGLDIIRRIISETPQYLKNSGLLLIEMGDDQGTEVLSLAAENGKYRQAEILKDLTGRDRFLKAVKR